MRVQRKGRHPGLAVVTASSDALIRPLSAQDQVRVRQQDHMSGLAGVAGAGPGGAERQGMTADPAVHLRILATTDLHSQILSYDYYTNRPQFGFGLAQTAALIAQARGEVDGTILLDNGDFLQGSALADLAARARRRRRNPMVSAFEALGYDAVSLGNHEFNYGLPILEAALKGAAFAAVSANVAHRLGDTPLRDKLLVSPYALLRRTLTDQDGRPAEIKIGVLGLTPPMIIDWDRTHLEGRIEVRGMREAASVWVPEMRSAGADVVVCLAHTGIEGQATGSAECLAAELAGLPGIDALVAGHTHRVFPQDLGEGRAYSDPRIDPENGRLSGKPAVQPGHGGSHLGVIDLWLQRRKGRWTVTSSAAAARSTSELIAGLTPERIRDAATPLRRRLFPDHRAALQWTRRTLGQSEVPLSTHFALVADCQAVRLIAAAKEDHVRRRLAGDAVSTLPILAAARAYRTGGPGGALNFSDIPAGPLSLRHVFDLYPFPNTIRAERVTGQEVRLRLERSAALYRTIRPGLPDQVFIDPAVPGYAYEMIPGLEYRIDLSRPPGRRVSGICLAGAPLSPDAEVILVTNSHFSGMIHRTGPHLLPDDTLVTDILADYLQRQGRIAPLPGPGWSFTGLPGTTVVCDAGTGALAHLSDVAHLRPELLGITPSGYHRFRLHL